MYHWVSTGPSYLGWGMYLMIHNEHCPAFRTWEQAMAFVDGRTQARARVGA